MHVRFVACLSVLAIAACKQPAPSAQEIRVAAASDLANAFPEVASAFEKKTQIKTTFSFGSSGLLAKQVLEGAPYDLFASANEAFVDDTIQGGMCAAATKVVYAEGRIAVWWKKDNATLPPSTLADLAEDRFHKIAIANPEHAPYGKAAEEALVKAGVYDKVKPKLVFGENIQQTLQFAQSGNVEAAIVAHALAMREPTGAYVGVDRALYQPIRQVMVVCGRRPSAEAAQRFAAFVTSDEGHAILRQNGFGFPGEGIATAP